MWDIKKYERLENVEDWKTQNIGKGGRCGTPVDEQIR